MPLIKRIGFWLFLALAIGGAVWGYIYLKQSKKPKVDAISVLPDSCLVYINTPDFFELNKKLNSQNLLVDKLKLFKDIHLFCNTLQTLDSIVSTSQTLHKELEDNLMHFALYKDLNWLISFNIKQLGDQSTVEEQILTTFHASKTGDGIYCFRLGAKQVYFTLNAGVTLLSDSKETLALALNTSLPKLNNNKAFLEFKTTLEEHSPLSIYTDHRFYGQSKAAKVLNLSVLFKKGYSAGTIDLQPSQITVNGFVSTDSTEILSLLTHQQAQETNFVNLLPLGVSSFTAYGFSSFAELKKRKEKLFPAPASPFWKLVNDSALYNLESEFYKNVSGCLVSFETQYPKQNSVLLKAEDTSKVAEHLKLMSDSVLHRDSVTVYRLKNTGQSPQLFFPLSAAATRYAMGYDAYVFFAESEAALFQLASDLKHGSVMTSNESFAAYKNQNFPETFNYLIYSAPNLVSGNMPVFFGFKAEDGINPYENFKHFSFCVTNDAAHFKFRWHVLNEAETVNKDQNVLWTLALDNESDMKASTFINHLTKENELVIQDNLNKIYLINAKGTVLWKKNLDEKIESPVFTVDLYKNNKYQLLFNTKNHLHLLDRNGNEVKGYPVKLPAEASASMALFDYDGDKDYRILIPCKNKTIYNYSILGVKQEKFVPVKTEEEVNLPVQYAKVGASDYLVALDKEGKIYTFSRKGASRIGLTNRTVQNCPAFYVDATNNINSTFFVYADDKNSLINKISFSDKKEIVKLNSELDDATVNFGLIDENRTMDLIFTRPNAIVAYDLNGNILFEKNAEGNFSETNFYSDESRSLFYTLNTAQHELFLTDQFKGKTVIYKATAMPLICDLFSDNKKYLLVTDGKQLNCVLLN